LAEGIDKEVRQSCIVLLNRCKDDVDDEVRDRAVLNLRLMQDKDEVTAKFVKSDSMFALQFLEHQLVAYVTSDEKSNFETPFDLSAIPVVTREQANAEDRTKKLKATTPSTKPPKTGPTKAAATGAEAAASASATVQKYAQELMQIPEMKEFGGVLKSSPIVELTETETEYMVTVVKHIFKEHVVFQYEVLNTLPATVLENVSVVATPADEELEEVFIISADKLETDVPAKVYVAFKKPEGSLPVTTFSNVLKFTSKEIDPTTNEPEESGYDDEYEVAEFDLTGSDYVVPTFSSNFAHLWEQVGAAGEEAEETLQLSGMKSIAGKFARFPTLIPGTSKRVKPTGRLTMKKQRPPSNWLRRYHYSRSKGRTCPSARPRTPSSFSARRSTAGRWWLRSEWLSRPSRVLLRRLRLGVMKRAWRLWLLGQLLR
jgi:coatomer protein complex subunit gamma